MNECIHIETILSEDCQVKFWNEQGNNSAVLLRVSEKTISILLQWKHLFFFHLFSVFSPCFWCTDFIKVISVCLHFPISTMGDEYFRSCQQRTLSSSNRNIQYKNLLFHISLSKESVLEWKHYLKKLQRKCIGSQYFLHRCLWCRRSSITEVTVLGSE